MRVHHGIDPERSTGSHTVSLCGVELPIGNPNPRNLPPCERCASVAADEAEHDEVICPDHWHCDPALAAHKCWELDRTIPCPACGAMPEIRVIRRSISARGRLAEDRPFVVYVGGVLLKDKRGGPKRFSSPPKARTYAARKPSV